MLTSRCLPEQFFHRCAVRKIAAQLRVNVLPKFQPWRSVMEDDFELENEPSLPEK